MDCSTPGSSVHHHLLSLLKYSRPLSQWYRPTISSSVAPFSSCLQSFPASGSSNESVLCIRWPKYLSASFSTSPSKEYSGLIFFRYDWFDFHAIQGTLKSLLQHNSSKYQFLGTQPYLLANSHIYMTTGKTIALTIWTSVSKVMFLLFKTLSSFDIAIREMQLKPGWWGCRQNWITHT